MRKRSLVILLLAGLFVVAILFFVFLDRSDEPVYSGRALSQWLNIYERHVYDRELSPESAEAENAVRSIGTNALPCLLSWIRYEPPIWRRKLRRSVPDFLADSAFLSGLIDGADDERSGQAIHGFAILGTNAVAAIPELSVMMSDTNAPTKSRRAMNALSGLGTPAFDLLASALSDPQRPNRFRIVYGLRLMAYSIGTNVCLPPLVKALADQDPFVRKAATNVLGSIAPEVLTNAPVLDRMTR